MTLEFFPGICSESYIGFLEAASWNRESIFLWLVFPLLPSSLLEQVDEMTLEWSSPCLTGKQGLWEYSDGTNQSNGDSRQGHKQLALGLQISSFSCNLLWLIKISQLYDNNWMLFYFIFQYIEWSGYGYYDIFICNSPVYFTSQMGAFHMWKCYLLMCLLLFVETGPDSVAKTGLEHIM